MHLTSVSMTKPERINLGKKVISKYQELLDYKDKNHYDAIVYFKSASWISTLIFLFLLRFRKFYMKKQIIIGSGCLSYYFWNTRLDKLQT